MTNKINICVCTYQRNELLKKCLLSLYDMEIPEDTAVSVCIIDNHPQQLGKSVVDELSPSGSLPSYYFHEQQRGIPHARNRALAESYTLNADFLVFIDDDEWVAPDWLCKLYGHCVQGGGELVVSGVVIAELPDNVPPAIAPLLTGNKPRATGTVLTACATNNVIFPLAISKKLEINFDTDNPQSGGEDTIFFTKMAVLGIAIEHCAEAIVYEHIPPSRTSLNWLAKRKFWAGMINAWRKQQLGRGSLSILASSSAQLLGYSLVVVLLSITGPLIQRNKSLLKVCRSAGEICGLLGVRKKSY